jgi:hypothetical protein
MSVTTLEVKNVSLEHWAELVALYNSFTAIESYPNVEVNMSMDTVVPTTRLIMVAPE